MVIFEKKQLTIVIKDTDIAERWKDTVYELLDLLYCKDEDFTQRHQNVLLLLEELMPDCRQVKAMMDIKPDTTINKTEELWKK